ncbi:MAG TPA: 16S rRNA (uracil(1498)-N(3))-methyltransferase, partial [Desulfurivibrio alkaliphilus]|nr:16S rRNA (uracil(1498)-N(3))-methyltransferase [Desulfurivibrio alkaliphilus]
MNIILIHPGEAEGDRVILRDHRARHIRRILKSKTGDTLRVGLLDGPMGTGLILGLAPDQVGAATGLPHPPAGQGRHRP